MNFSIEQNFKLYNKLQDLKAYIANLYVLPKKHDLSTTYLLFYPLSAQLLLKL